MSINTNNTNITNVSETDTMTCGGADGIISVTATTDNGTLEYSIDHTNRQANNTFTNLSK